MRRTSGRGFLEPARATRWRARYTTSPAETIKRYRGRTGLAEFLGSTHVDSADPDGFEALLHTTVVGTVTVSNCLLTPCAVSHHRAVEDHSRDAELSLLVFSSSGCVTRRPGGFEATFTAGQLVVLSNAIEWELSVRESCEYARMSIPFSTFSSDAQAMLHRLRPTPTDTALVRAVGAFVVRLARTSWAPVSSPSIDAAIQSASVELVKSVADQQTYRPYSLDDVATKIRRRATELIEREFRDPEFGVEAVSRELKLSRRQLSRYFATSNESIGEMIATRRLKEARMLLIEMPQMPIADVATAAGFSSVSTMRHRLRHTLGLTPVEVRAGAIPRHNRDVAHGPGEVVDFGW